MSAFLRGVHLRKLYTASRQILRFSCAKNFNLFPVVAEVQQSAYGSSNAFQRNLATVAPKYINEEHTKVSDALSADEYIDSVLAKIDSEAKKFGHVMKKDVDAVFKRIQQSGSVTSIQSLYIIRCCGSLLSYESPTERTKLVHNIWNSFLELGIPMDASHFNAVLKCYLENEHQFSPPEFLAAMENKGVVPNRVTYQRIIDQYCRNGDLNGSSAILEHMKSKDFPINEAIFNSLVLGHARAKDLKGATNMLDVMRKSQLEPTSDTYAILAYGFAENGDMEGFSNVLHEAEEKQLYFTGKHYILMVESLVSSGNMEYVDEILVKANVRYCRPEAMNSALCLVSRGFVDGAYQIMAALSSLGFQIPFYSFLKALAAKENSFEKMLEFCRDLYSKGIHKYVFEEAAKVLLVLERTDDVFAIYKEMKDLGRPLRFQYFWPILAIHRNNGNIEGIYATLKFMSDLALPADVDTYVDYVLDDMITTDLNAVISKIKELGQPEETAIDAIFMYFCVKDQIREAIDFHRDYHPHFDLSNLINTFAGTDHKDIELSVELVRQISKEASLDLDKDVPAMFLERVLYYHHNDFSLLEQYLREYANQGIKLTMSSVEGLGLRLRSSAPGLLVLLQNLELNVIRDLNLDSDYIPPSKMNLPELEEHLAKVKEAGGNTRPYLRHLLSHYCRHKVLDRALEIKAELDAINFTYSPAAYALLVNLFVSHNNLEEAMKFKREIDEQYPHFKLDVAKGLDLLGLMIKHDKIDEAFEYIEKDALDWIPTRYNEMMGTSVKNLLHIAADTGNVEVTRKLFHKFVLDLQFAQVHHTILEPLIKVHLVRNDTDAALEEYNNCVVNHKVFPSRNYLFKKFITMKDPERLQKVVDISTTYGGREIALHELAGAFIESGCLPEARKVIQTLGYKADTKQLDILCYRFYKQNKVLELEQLLSITKDLNHIDRDQLYTHLLNLYTENNDHQAALEMWNSMQEDNIQPSSSTLQRLADLLEKNNQPIPFVVPLISESLSASHLTKILAEKDEVQIVNVLKRMKKGEVHSIPQADFTTIVDILLEKKCLKEIVDIVQVMSCILAHSAEILKPVANKYSAAGDVASLKMLHDNMPDFTHKAMAFNANLFEAFINSGKPEVLLDELEQNMNTAKRLFSFTGFLKLLQRYPELIDRAISLTDKYLEQENFDAPKMVLWTHYLIQGNFNEADKIFKKIPIMAQKSDFAIVRLIQEVRSTQNEVLGRKLVEIANNSLRGNVKTRAYSHFLDILVQKEKLEEALELINEAKSNGVPTEKLFHLTLVNLKNSLTERNMPVPFDISSKGGDSSSSDSD